MDLSLEMNRFNPNGYRLTFLNIVAIPNTSVEGFEMLTKSSMGDTHIIMGTVIKDGEVLPDADNTSVEFIIVAAMNPNNTIFMETKYVSKLPMAKNSEVKLFKVDELRFKDRRRITTAYGFDYFHLDEALHEMVYRLMPWVKTNFHQSELS